MTKKKIILYVIAIICAISGIVALPSGNIAGGIGSLIIAAALALWGSKSTPQKATQPRTHIIPVQPAVAPTETIRTKLTGVTFENEDGENRQDILAEMTGDEEIEVEKYTFNGEPAARIKWGEKVLGNISAELARDLALKYPSAQYAANLLEISGGGTVLRLQY